MLVKVALFGVLLFSLSLSFQKTTAQEKLSIHSLPQDSPTRLSLPISYLGEKLTLEIEKCCVYGQNTRFLIDDGTGKLIEISKLKECAYTGYIKEHPNYSVNAILAPKGLTATITISKTATIEIRPHSTEGSTHLIYSESTSGSSVNKANEDKNDIQIQKDVLSLLEPDLSIETTVEVNTLENSTNDGATLPPTTVMDVLEYEIGVEIGSRSYFGSAYNGDLQTAQASAQSIIGNLNQRYLHGSGVKFTLGTVIIRTNIDTDPLREKVVSTGAAENASSSLAAFKDYWNSHPEEVGSTHDVAVYHVKSAPSGLAYVNKVGTSHRYATMGGNGATSWANGTAVHEVGHIFNLHHTNSSGIFYENRPRNDKGSKEAGGRDYYISVMHGSGNHNIGRFATNEAKIVRNVLMAKRAIGEVPKNLEDVRPFGVYDEYFIESNDPKTLDVVANDYDMNNDILNVRLLDEVSNLGGTINLSKGTGPGGRNELIYTPPATGLTARDFFHYTVYDSTKRTDFAAVYIENDISYFSVDSEEFRFDFGTRSSNVWPMYDRVHSKTNKELYGWTNPTDIGDRDRGADANTNDLNRDICQSTSPGIFEVNVKNGIWKVLVTFGDRDYSHDNMFLKVEGEDKIRNVNASAGNFFNKICEVEVTDGKLTMEFSDRGGSDANWAVSRVILTYVPPTAIPEDINGNELIVYPNPTSDLLHIKIPQTEEWRICVLNASGKRIVEHESQTYKERNEVTLYTESWTPGIYIVKIESKNKQIIKKVIVN